jgi:voltage-gated hydrogen channel 1
MTPSSHGSTSRLTAPADLSRLDTGPDADQASSQPSASLWTRARAATQARLETRAKHYVVLALVSLDVAVLLADVFVALIACDLDSRDAPWAARTQEGTKIAGLVFSCLFLAELLLAVWASGPRDFFGSWFRCFDAAVIVVSFVVDIVAHGVAGEIASLVVVLRLTRLLKIVEEVSAGAGERVEQLEGQVAGLEGEKAALLARLGEMEEGRRGG